MPQGGIDAGKNQATPFTELRDEAGVTYSHPQGWVTLQTLPNEVLVVLRKVIRQHKEGSTRKFNLYITRKQAAQPPFYLEKSYTYQK